MPFRHRLPYLFPPIRPPETELTRTRSSDPTSSMQLDGVTGSVPALFPSGLFSNPRASANSFVALTSSGTGIGYCMALAMFALTIVLVQVSPSSYTSPRSLEKIFKQRLLNRRANQYRRIADIVIGDKESHRIAQNQSLLILQRSRGEGRSHLLSDACAEPAFFLPSAQEYHNSY